MKGALTTIAGVESLAKQEITRLGGKVTQVHDRLVFFEGDIAMLVSLNMWSRVGNKVYAQVAADRIETFDDLFDIVRSVAWDKWIPKDSPILVDALSIRSLLESVPALQRTTKKAIVTGITGKKDALLVEDEKKMPVRILVCIVENICHILLDTSWDPLHKRGYRQDAGEAPIKESLAAALVLLSNWRFSEPFFDPFCGSGTIAIEAAMIAKNIAPGLHRFFAFERLPFVWRELSERIRKEARQKMFLEKKHVIYGFDQSQDAIKSARENAYRAEVGDFIDFRFATFPQSMDEYAQMGGMILTNPPYGIRLNDDAQKVHEDLARFLKKNPNFSAWIYTAYLEKEDLFLKNKAYKSRKLYNGDLKAYLFTNL